MVHLKAKLSSDRTEVDEKFCDDNVIDIEFNTEQDASKYMQAMMAKNPWWNFYVLCDSGDIL